MLAFFRAIKFSLQDIGRNFWLSVITVSVLVLALLSVNVLLAVKAISTAAMQTVQDKIDISLYLTKDVTDQQALALRDQINALPDVKSVDYVSQAAALAKFKAKRQSDMDVIAALQELNKNPLSPSLIVKPKDTKNYNQLADQLANLNSPIVVSRNSDDNRDMLTKINSISNRVNEAGWIISLILILAGMLVAYNAIRVSIYTHREEIAIMRLVGASNWFVKAPFLFTALIYAFTATLLVVALFYSFLNLLQPYLETFFAGYNFNLILYFNANWLLFFGGQFLGALIINIVASAAALNRYSKI